VECDYYVHFAQFYGEAGLKGYVGMSWKIAFSKNSQKMGVQNNQVVTLHAGA
jgi:hypothetical protein